MDNEAITSKLLFDEPPLVIIPKLARKVGLHEAVVLQQVHYWVEVNKAKKHNFRDGFYWTYNSYSEWAEQFPFSPSTVKRVIRKLEKTKLLITGIFNKLQIDRTKWYRINYEELGRIMNETSMVQAQSEHHTSTGQVPDEHQANSMEYGMENDINCNQKKSDEIESRAKEGAKNELGMLPEMRKTLTSENPTSVNLGAENCVVLSEGNENRTVEPSFPLGQNGPSIGSKWSDGGVRLTRPLPENNAENYAERENEVPVQTTGYFSRMLADLKNNFLRELIEEAGLNSVSSAVSVIDYYFEAYHEWYGRSHPCLKPDQLERVIRFLVTNMRKLDILPEHVQDMIDHHFSREDLEHDGNINFFAQEGIFFWLAVNVCGACPDYSMYAEHGAGEREEEW